LKSLDHNAAANLYKLCGLVQRRVANGHKIFSPDVARPHVIDSPPA
jgi:hypothetical protein